MNKYWSTKNKTGSTLFLSSGKKIPFIRRPTWVYRIKAQVLVYRSYPSDIRILWPTSRYFPRERHLAVSKVFMGIGHSGSIFTGCTQISKRHGATTRVQKATPPSSIFTLDLLLLSFLRIELWTPIKKFGADYQAFHQILPLPKINLFLYYFLKIWYLR